MPEVKKIAREFDSRMKDYVRRNSGRNGNGVYFDTMVGVNIKEVLQQGLKEPYTIGSDNLDGLVQIRTIRGGRFWVVLSIHEYDTRTDVYYGVFNSISTVLPTPYALARISGSDERVWRAVDSIERFLQSAS